jgi:protein-S-isoprenylcysteine O-methyltransferase Ste14
MFVFILYISRFESVPGLYDHPVYLANLVAMAISSSSSLWLTTTATTLLAAADRFREEEEEEALLN